MGPKRGAQRAKTAKNLRGNTKVKRFKNEDSEKQKAYKAKLQARRLKKNK